MSLFLFLSISVNIVLFSWRLLWISGETSCNFLLKSLGILSCASCSSPLRATTAFTSGMVDLTRSLCFRCALLSLLVAQSFILYISGFSKGVFKNGQFSGISVFFGSSFWESPSLDFPQILSKTSPGLVSIGRLSLLGQMQGDPCMNYLDLLLLQHLSPLWSIY